MTSYRLARIADAPDLAPSFGVGPREFELRILRDVLGCERIGVSYERFGAGWKPTTGHRHPPGEEEVYVLISGRAQAKVDEEIVDLEPWTALWVAPSAARAIRAVGEEDAVFIAVGAGKSDRERTEFLPRFWPSEDGANAGP